MTSAANRLLSDIWNPASICCVSTYVSRAISTRFIAVDSYENGECDLTRRDKYDLDFLTAKINQQRNNETLFVQTASFLWRDEKKSTDEWMVGSVTYVRIKIWYATVKPYAKTRQIDTGLNVIHRNILVVLRSFAMEYRLTLLNALLLIHAVEFTNDNVKLTIIERFTYASLLSRLRNYSIASGVIDLWTSLSHNRPIIYIIKLSISWSSLLIFYTNQMSTFLHVSLEILLSLNLNPIELFTANTIV